MCKITEFIGHKDVKISDILSEMFDHCLAPDTSGDGVGCDNMTGIIYCSAKARNYTTTHSRYNSTTESAIENFEKAEI